jgi:hypothetical protein
MASGCSHCRLGCSPAWLTSLRPRPLISHGVDPGLAVGGMAFGAATTRAALDLVAAEYGARARVLLVGSAALGSIGLGALTSLLARGDLLPSPMRLALPPPVEWLSLGLLTIVLLRNVWKVGTRGWLAASLLGRQARRVDGRHAH